MNTFWYLVNFLVFTQFVLCRDFYLGMFRRNDFLVAQDVLYKAPAPFGYTTASYGRLFKCPITYFRVVDRLGQGRGPITTIVRGGLRKKYISVRIKSTYRLPISVNIYVGCENKQPITFRTIKRTPATTAMSNDTDKDGAEDSIRTTIADSNDTATDPDAANPEEGGATTAESAAGDVTGGDAADGITEPSDAGEATPEPEADA